MLDESASPVAGRVLVVDDDESVRALFVATLRAVGLDALGVGDGYSALELIRRNGIAAVLLDSRMPDMDGLTVLSALRSRAQSRTLPVILVTGSGDIADRVRGLEAGANDYLVKPVALEEMVARVKAQLRGQAAWMRLLEGQLRQRNAVTEALCRLRPERTPELTADLICRELARLRYLEGAVLLAFTQGGAATPLARYGRVSRSVRIGRALSAVTATRLVEQAAKGAWTEHRSSQPPGADGPPLVGPDAVNAAYAPLHSQGRLLGLLALSTGPGPDDNPSDELAQALSAAIDFAAISAALLGPALRSRFELRTTQAGLQHILDSVAYQPVFQPVVDLEVGTTVGYEALTRFADGTEPQHRFAEAAKVSMGDSIERTTASAALAAATGHMQGGWLSINVSPTFLSSGDLRELLDGTDIRLVLELTEHDPVDDYDQILRALRALGGDVLLSIDDAGAGYACLTHVLSLQPQFIKLDRGWVTGIDADPAREALVAGLQSFANRTGSTLIAEGIETEAELETLRGLHVRLGQGFLLGRPHTLEGPAAPALAIGGLR